MLYDPKWQKSKTTVPCLDGLIAWLETQSPEGEYDWSNCEGECLIHRYLISCGLETLREWDEWYFLAQGPWNAPTEIAVESPRTFGAALRRAKAVRDQGIPYPSTPDHPANAESVI